MFKRLISIVISASCTIALGAGIKQFPDSNHTYDGKDTGFSKYLAPSLYRTNQVALTFDDGPHPTRTPQLLDTLKKHHVKATFFVLASQITPATEHIVERIVREGHTLAGHDWTHNNNNKEN
jgi:peptidoglycan/xylan/chitin deacetylase (PgdA/CDA1 family)